MGYSHWHGPYASFEERKKHFFQNVKLRLRRPASVHEQSAYYLSNSAGAAATKYHQLGAGGGGLGTNTRSLLLTVLGMGVRGHGGGTVWLGGDPLSVMALFSLNCHVAENRDVTGAITCLLS